MRVSLVWFEGWRGKYHAVVCARLATEGERGLRDTFVDDTVGEHRLGSDTHDECAEINVVSWLGVCPHACHVLVICTSYLSKES